MKYPYLGYNINIFNGKPGRTITSGRPDLEDEVPETGLNPDGSTWVRYPKVGKAIQSDAFINEQARKALRESKTK